MRKKLHFLMLMAFLLFLFHSQGKAFLDDENPCPLSGGVMAQYKPSTGTTRALVIFIKFSDDFWTHPSAPGTTDGWNPFTYNSTRPP